MISSLQVAALNTSYSQIKKTLLNMNSSGKKIELKVGTEIQIELQGIGATGYSWYVDQLDLDLFELISEERREKKKESNDLTGNPLFFFWNLKTKKPGTSTIRLDYYRLWEGKDKATQRFEISVNIHP